MQKVTIAKPTLLVILILAFFSGAGITRLATSGDKEPFVMVSHSLPNPDMEFVRNKYHSCRFIQKDTNLVCIYPQGVDAEYILPRQQGSGK